MMAKVILFSGILPVAHQVVVTNVTDTDHRYLLGQ